MFGYVGTPVPTPVSSAAPPSNPIDKREVVERYRRAIDLLTANDVKGAIEQFRTLAAQEPAMRDVWMLLANTAWRADRPDIVLDAYEHAAQLEPANNDARLGAATALLRLHRLDDAAARAQSVVDEETADPRSQSRAHEVLAQVALARRNVDIARSEAALAEEADPSRPVRAYVDGRLAFDRRHYAEALELFEPALERVEKTPRQPLADLRLVTAEALARQDRSSEAEYLFLEELEQSPFSERARSGLTALYKATGRATEAAALAQH
jgi:tetratricopeptide (TPR) repeat protein